MATVHLVRRLSLLQGALTQMHGRTPFLALDCCEREKKNKKNKNVEALHGPAIYAPPLCGRVRPRGWHLSLRMLSSL